MRKKLLGIVIIISGIIPWLQTANAQNDSCKWTTSVSADLVSTYIWRGTVSDQSPNIQPTLSLSRGNFTLGAWGSTNFNGTYKEVDLFASYVYKRFTLTITDYQWTPFIDNIRYFNYKKDETGHIFEGTLCYKGGAKFPICITANTFFYGNDQKVDDNGKLENQYSSYIECMYPFNWKGNKVEAFMGLTPDKGYYGDSFGVVNCGFTSYKTIKVTNTFEIPMKGSLIFNPQAGRAYFMVGITL